MKITKITYTERKNLGNYEHSEITTEAEVFEGESAEMVLADLKSFTRDGLYGPEQLPLVPQVGMSEKKEEIDSPQKEKKTKKKKKEIAYSREDAIHKKIFVETLSTLFPEWKKNADKAKSVSISLEGEEFISDNLEVLESFKNKLTEAMK